MAHFFGSGDELRDVMVPYFKAGLENNERCLWVTGRAFTAEQARSALRTALPNLDQRERSGQIEIADASSWYAAGEKLRPAELVEGLLQREQDALALGYTGIRTSGNCAWVEPTQWTDFLEYEDRVQEAVQGRQMICMCSYCADTLDGSGHLAIMGRHQIVVPSAASHRSRTDTDAVAADAAGSAFSGIRERQRIFDLAMTASRMGTWRYTIADNVCMYDEHAQRLYGLADARFLHDDAGVRAKFHPDDLDGMWTRVAAALDPQGDGRYDVEYRVKQEDGSWRWLSAWGLVEFVGEGADRTAVAIAGASRDLTEMKQAEEMQRLLLGELKHRVKNTLATIQAITGQTLRSAQDLPSAQAAVEQRICSMARAHDLLTSREWTGTNLADVVATALEAFGPDQVRLAGPDVEISPERTLAIAMALHELATNATKYGALSRPQGTVSVTWSVADGRLELQWQEDGGPPVSPPTRKGFGSRLLERLLVRDLGGEVRLDYDAAGVRFMLAAKL